MTHPIIRILVTSTLLLLAGNLSAKDQRNTSCLREKFDIISVIDLSTCSLEGESGVLENGDTAEVEELILAYFMENHTPYTLSSLGKCTDAVERANGILENRYKFWVYDEYALPEDLNWNENPAASRNWTYYLLSFEFLWILNEAYQETGTLAYLEKGGLLIEDFARDCLDPSSLPNRNIWYDHTASNRLVYLIDYWFLCRAAGIVTPEFTSLMLELLWRHARFLSNPANYNPKTNHGLFNCLALERFAFAFPEMTQADAFLSLSLGWFKKQLEDNFDKDGVHREYSPWYQVWIVGLLKVYAEDCARNGVQLPESCKETGDKAIQVCTHFFHPDWTIALFGDSDLHLTEKMMDLVMGDHPWLKFISTKGNAGEAPTINSVGLTDSHIYIMRSGWGKKRSYEDESCLMAFFTREATNHNHEDLMGFELYSKGVKWITDLGRYNYNYREQERKYIISAEAHNGITAERYVAASEARGSRPGAGSKSRRAAYREERMAKEQARINRRNLETRMDQISGESDPEKKVDLYRALLDKAEDKDKARIKFTTAFVLAEEVNDTSAAIVLLNDIINNSTDDEIVAHARQYLTIISGAQAEPSKTGAEQERAWGKRTELEKVGPPSGTGPKVLTWISGPKYDYLESYMRYERGYLHHSRAILFIKPHYYLVMDRFYSKEKLRVRQLFHFPPDVSVDDKGDSDYILETSQGRACIMNGIMLASVAESEIIRGRTESGYQGWYSGTFGNFVPASVLQNHLTFSDEAYAMFLFVPTGQRNPGSFDVSIDHNFNDELMDGSTRQVRVEIITPRQKTQVRYSPTAKFLDHSVSETGSPLISIRKSRR